MWWILSQLQTLEHGLEQGLVCCGQWAASAVAGISLVDLCSDPSQKACGLHCHLGMVPTN